MLNRYLPQLTSFFTGNIGTYIKIALWASAATFVGFLWFSRAEAMSELKQCQKANVENVARIAQITEDIKDVRVKQELAVMERTKIQKETAATLVKIAKQNVPKNCPDIVKWAKENKDDTKW